MKNVAWNKVKVGSLCTRVTSGGTPKSTNAEYYDNGKIPWLNSKEVNFSHIYSTEKFITEKGLAESSAKWIEKNSVIVAMYGATAGQVAIAKIPLTTNQACCNLTIDDKLADYRYVYYYLWNQYQVLSGLANGGAQQNLNAQIIKEFEIQLPELSVQKSISEILFSLDEQIRINNTINHNLEEQAKAIFKSWFVDFEPFNGKMPKSWLAKTLADVSKIGAGGDKPHCVSEIQTPEFQYPIYSNGLANDGLYGYASSAKIYEESITVSARGTIGFVCLRQEPYVPIVRLITLIPNTCFVSAKYLYLYLKGINISGTGTTQQQLTVPDFQKTSIMVPDNDTMKRFTICADSIFEQIKHNAKEMRTLAQLRDTLLPKLMSGEIDVSEVEV